MRLDVLVTARDAARLLDVPIGTVRSWHERGLLTPRRAALRSGDAHWYAVGDVLRAERESRRRDPTRRRARQVAMRAEREAD